MNFLRARRARPIECTDRRTDRQLSRWAWALLAIATTYLASAILPTLVHLWVTP